MSPYTENKIKKAMILTYPHLTEDDIKISTYPNKNGYSVSVYTTERRKRINFKVFTGLTKCQIDDEIMVWIRGELYSAHNKFKNIFNQSIRQMVGIEQFIENVYDITINPR
jgi:hypothetical protein